MWRINIIIPLNLSTFISQISAAGVHNDRGLPTSARRGCVTLEQVSQSHRALAGYVRRTRHASPPRAGIPGMQLGMPG